MQMKNKMKKFFISICVALVGLSVSAQEKGDMAVGLNLGVAPSLESGAKVTNFGIGAKFQYNVTNPIRLEAALDYGFKNKGCDVMNLGINAHYIFKVGDKLNVYPLVGLGYAHIGGGGSKGGDDFDEDDFKHLWSRSSDLDKEGGSSASKFLFNVGAGIEYPITDKLAVGAEIKYQYIKNFNRLPISVGITYKF